MQCPRCSFRLPKRTLVCARCGEKTPRALALPMDTKPPAEGPRKGITHEVQIDRRGRGVRALGALGAKRPAWVRNNDHRGRAPVRPAPAAVKAAMGEAPAVLAPVQAMPSVIYSAKTDPGWHREPAMDLETARVSVAELPFERPTNVWDSAPLGARLGAAAVDASVMAGSTLGAVLLGAFAYGPSRVQPFLDRGVDYVFDGLLVRQQLGLLLFALAMCLSFTYLSLSHALLGATVGKRLFGLRVIDSDGRLPGMKVSSWRAVGSFVSLLPACAGFALALFDSRLLTLHDRLVGTRVVLEPAESGSDDPSADIEVAGIAPAN